MKRISIIALCFFSMCAYAEDTTHPIVAGGEAVIEDFTPAPPVSNSQGSIVDAWEKYLSQLKSCAAGDFVLTQINPLLSAQYGKVETDKVLGWDGEKCHLTMMYYGENDPRLTKVAQQGKQYNQYPTGQDCYFSREALDSLIAFDTGILQGQIIVTLNDDRYSNAIAQNCASYVVIDGNKVS